MPLPHSIALVGALYPSPTRGLAADLASAHRLGAIGLPVCTALVAASEGVVTDVTDVPADTVTAQLEHLARVSPPAAVKIGVLAGHRTVEAVFRFAERVEGPVVLDVVLSGPNGETLLTARGMEALTERLGVADLVIVGRDDAELLSGGEIRSLDDAQVAVQRLSRLGARHVVVKCGALPARFFDAQSDPGQHDGPFASDLYYDGQDFTLFEAPLLENVPDVGASSAFAVAATLALASDETVERAVQAAKRSTADLLRGAAVVMGG